MIKITFSYLFYAPFLYSLNLQVYVWIFLFRFTQLHNGSGPRHMAIDEQSGRAYLVTELDSKLIAFKIDYLTGDLIEIEKLYKFSFLV